MCKVIRKGREHYPGAHANGRKDTAMNARKRHNANDQTITPEHVVCGMSIVRHAHAKKSSGTTTTSSTICAVRLFGISLLALAAFAGRAAAQAPPQDPTQVDITGFIQAATV